MRNIVSQILNARKVRADVVTTNSVNGVSSEEHARVKGVKYPIQEQIDSLVKKKNDLENITISVRSDVADAINEKNPDANLTGESSPATFAEAIRAIKLGGGLEYKRVLTANDNLDGVVEDGFYDFAAASLPINRPSDAFALNGMVLVEALPAIDSILQTYYMFNGNEISVWNRKRFGRNWSTWLKYVTETNTSAQALLKKTPVFYQRLHDDDSVFGIINGNVGSFSLDFIWYWILDILKNFGISESITISTDMPTLVLDCPNKAGAVFVIGKTVSSSTIGPSVLLDRTDGKQTTRMELYDGRVTINGAIVVTEDLLRYKYAGIERISELIARVEALEQRVSSLESRA